MSNVPVSERRFVAVVAQLGESDTKRDIGHIGPMVALGGLFGGPIGAAAAGALGAVMSEKKSLPPSVRRVLLADLDQGLRFPPGHPIVGMTYAANPRRPQFYIPVAELHRISLREKAAELFRLLAALRAREIAIQVDQGRVKSSGLQLSALIPAQLPVAVDLDASRTSKSGTSISYVAKFSGRGAPYVPSDLAWYDHEPEWQALAEARLAGEPVDIRLSFRFADDFGVNLNLVAGIEAFGLQVGGKYEEFEAEDWRLVGRFSGKPLFGW